MPARSAGGGSPSGTIARSRAAPASASGRSRSRAAAMFAPFEKPTAIGARQAVGLARLGDEVGELVRAAAHVLLVEDALRQPAEEAGHAVLEHLAPRGQERGPGCHRAPEREEVVLVAARAVQEQEGRPAGLGPGLEAMDEGQRRLLVMADLARPRGVPAPVRRARADRRDEDRVGAASGDRRQDGLDLLRGAAPGTGAASGPARARRPARPRRSPARRSRSRTGCRRAPGSRPSGSSCGPSARSSGCRWSRASLLAISACAASSAARNAMWWTEPPPIRPGRKPPAARMSTMPPMARVAGPEADDGAFAAGLGEAEHVGQDRAGRCRVLQQQADAVEAADRVLGRDLAVAPGRLVLDAGDGDERQVHAVPVLEREHGLAEALLQRLVRDALLDEAVRPVADGTLGHPEQRSPGSGRRRAGPGRHAPTGRRSGSCRAGLPRRRSRGGRCPDRRS